MIQKERTLSETSPSGRFHLLAVESYGKHYQRVNSTVNPNQLCNTSLFRAMDMMYKPLINSIPVGGKVLDLGCDTGFLLSWLKRQPHLRPIGVDACPSIIEAARKALPDAEIYFSDGLEFLLTHKDEFHAIFCMDVLEHTPTDDLLLEWLQAAKDALRQNGFFFCRVPNAANLSAAYSRYMDLTHHRMFAAPSLLQAPETAGFDDSKIVPITAAHLTGRARLQLEALLHKGVFQLCRGGLESVFTYNICAIGWRR